MYAEASVTHLVFSRYEEGKTTLFKECPAADFVWAEKPLDLLGTITSITFADESSLPIKDHPLTTREVRLQCLSKSCGLSG